MIDGLDGDDMWRMVEDEFLTVAGAFTAHLHRAEYRKLKSLTESQNAKTISAISRPVACDKTSAVKRREDRLDLERRQDAAMKRARGSTGQKSANQSDYEDGPSPWVGTALQGLMDSPRKRAPRLMSDIVKKATVKQPVLRSKEEASMRVRSQSSHHITRTTSVNSRSQSPSLPRDRRGAVNTEEKTQSEGESDDDLDAEPRQFAHSRNTTPLSKHVDLAADPETAQGRRVNATSRGAGSSAPTPQRVSDTTAVRKTASSTPHSNMDCEDSDSSDGILARSRKRRERLREQQWNSRAPENTPLRRGSHKKSTDTILDIVPSFI